MAVVYVLKITAVTPRGEFTGTVGEQDADRSVMEQLVVALRESLNRMSCLAFDTEDGYEVILNQQMLEQSVLKFKVATKIVN